MSAEKKFTESLETKCEKSDVTSSSHGPLIGKRHIQCLLLFFVTIITYWTRTIVSVAIVSMTNTNSTNPNFQAFNWNEQEKSYILSSFFWGYIFTQLPGGLLSNKYGSKMLLLSAVLLPSILTMLTPILTIYGDWEAFCGVRAIQGMATGVVFPACHNHLSKWSPVEERNRFGGFIYSGVEIGVVLAFISSGPIAATVLGWPGIFYVSGTAGVVWSAIWIYYGADTPDHCASITAAEKNYIQESLGKVEVKKTYRIPWKEICTSVPFLALICVRLSQAWGSITILTEMPTYMDRILKLDTTSNALLTAFPYIVMWFLALIFIFLADAISKRKFSNLAVIRKTYSTISQWIPAAALIGFSFVTKDEIPLAVTLLTIAVGANAATTLGNTLNHIDLAPNLAGPLMGIVNTLANIINLIVPLIVGGIVSDEKDQSQWQIVFCLSAAVLVVGNSIFLIFGQATAQPWNDLALASPDTRRSSLYVISDPPVIK